VPQRLPRFYLHQQKAEDLRKLARILLETGASLDELQGKTWKPVNGAGGAEPARLRGLPAIGRNVSGAIPGTDPLRALLAKESRRR